MSYQPHAGLLRSAATFPVIALETACDDISPGFPPSFYYGLNVVKCEILSGAFFPAILAGVVIASINICSAKLDMLEALSGLYIFQQSEDTRQLDGKTDAPDLTIIFGQNFNFALVQQVESALPGDNIDWLIGCIQNQSMFHQNSSIKEVRAYCSKVTDTELRDCPTAASISYRFSASSRTANIAIFGGRTHPKNFRRETICG
jgi:hypothetical protein